jgi:hypothetical protein
VWIVRSAGMQSDGPLQHRALSKIPYNYIGGTTAKPQPEWGEVEKSFYKTWTRRRVKAAAYRPQGTAKRDWRRAQPVLQYLVMQRAMPVSVAALLRGAEGKLIVDFEKTYSPRNDAPTARVTYHDTAVVNRYSELLAIPIIS